MNIIIIGNTLSAMKAAAKSRRELGFDHTITLVTNGDFHAYTDICMGDVISGVVTSDEELHDFTPEHYGALVGVNVITGVNVSAVDPSAKEVFLESVSGSSKTALPFDKLILACGKLSASTSSGLSFPAAGVYSFSSIRDIQQMKQAASSGTMKKAVISGCTADSVALASYLSQQGIRATICEPSEAIFDTLDKDYSEFLENELVSNGIPVFTSAPIVEVIGKDCVEKVSIGKKAFKADTLIFAVKPGANTSWIDAASIARDDCGDIAVDEHFQTSVPNIFACGECSSVRGSDTSQGRFVAQVISETALSISPVSTRASYFKVLNYNVGSVGQTKSDAHQCGVEAESCTITTDDRVRYYPGKEPLIIRLTARKDNEQIIGLQVISRGPIDKLLDSAVIAISSGCSLTQVSRMDFAYHPSFATPVTPFAIAANSLLNKLHAPYLSGTYAELDKSVPYTLLDVGRIATSPNQIRHIPVEALNAPIEDLPTSERIVLFCPGGRFSYLAANKLFHLGYTNLFTIEGGTVFNKEILEEIQ